MAIHLLMIALALAVLVAGAESVVRGASALALRLGLSRLAIGLTVVAFGTSAPELVVSLKAALDGAGDIAVGNVIGSNIFNIAVILGLAALICPIPVHEQVVRLDAPIAFAVALLLLPLLGDGVITRSEGVLLLLGLIAYTALNLVLARRRMRAGLQDWPDAPFAGGATRRLWRELLLIAAGLGLLVVGAGLLVSHAASLARALGVQEAVIGLTIVAAGTSLPELATSLVAAWRRQADIAVGNVVGSNVFNVLGILGASSALRPITSAGIGSLDLLAMSLLSLLLLPLLYTGRTLHRLEGLLLLVLYGGYLAWRWPA
ncbi:MAG: sodium:calcium antiporter [Lysobacterales bacterium]|jgi:cation:H+ antiporter|nr:MAG: sodium:calcium antiporter [Xanthomonadales bacterium]